MVYHMKQPSTFTYFLASMPSDFMAFADLRIFYDLVREADPTWRLDDTSKFGIVVNKIDQVRCRPQNHSYPRSFLLLLLLPPIPPNFLGAAEA
jgi:hypothetical protein